MASSAKDWPDPPLWMSFNPDAKQLHHVNSARATTGSIAVSLNKLAPVNSIHRRTTEPRLSGYKHSLYGKHYCEDNRYDQSDIGAQVTAENTVLSTSSLSEAPGDASNRRSVISILSERSKAMASIDVEKLSVDFDDPQTILGVGTVGTVFQGTYYGDQVVVKRVRMPRPPRQLREDPHALGKRKERLRKFARDLRKYEVARHPSIVHLIGVSIPSDYRSAFLVMEQMQGGNLLENIRSLKNAKQSPDISSLLRVAVQIVGAVRFLHRNNLAWGGVKPENVLLSESMDSATGKVPDSVRVCISDLGLSSAASNHVLSESYLSTSTTAQPVLGFKSPEMLEDKLADGVESAKASDIYSLGSLLFFLITQRIPWANVSMTTLIMAIMQKKRPQWPRSTEPDFRSDIPSSLKELVEQCWANVPEDRPTADNVLQALVKIRGSVADQMVAPPGNRLNEESRLSASQEGFDRNLYKKLSSPSSQASTVAPVSVDTASPYAVPSPTTGSQNEDLSEDLRSSAKTVPPEGVEIRAHENTVHTHRTSPLTSPDIRRKVSNPSVSSNFSVPPASNRNGSDLLTSIASPVSAMPKKNSVAEPESSIDDAEAIESIYKRSVDASEQGELRLDLPSMARKNSETRRSELVLFNSEESVKQKAGETLLTGDYAETLAVAAMKFDRKHKAAQTSEHPDNMSSGAVQGNPNILSQTMAGFNLFESTGPDASTTTIAASMRRKRSSQIQAVIERAGAALLELQRREEIKGVTPPSQKRRQARSKAEEEARKSAEEKAIQTISEYRHQRKYSEVLLVMDDHIEDELVIKAGLLAIEEAAAKDIVYLDICEEGAVERLHGAMSRYGEHNVEMCKSFCRSVSAFCCWRNDKVDQRVRAAGIPSEIVTVMSHHQSDVSLLTAACRSLGFAAKASELTQKAVATLGGPLAVYRAMTRNIATYKDVEFARASLIAVQCIAAKNEAAAETLVQVCGLDAVARTAEVFPSHGLEKNILDALEAFVFYDNGRKALVTSNGLQALSSLMLRRQDVEFSEQCCVFIRSIAQKSEPKYEQSMLESAIPERAVMTVRLSDRYPGDEGGRLAFYASQAVMYLASFGVQTRERLRMVGALNVIIHLLHSRSYNRRVVTMATNALVELMKGDRESQVQAERLGAVALLINAAEMYRHEQNVFGAVSLTLGFFASMRQGRIPPSDPLHAYSKYAVRNGAKRKGGARWRLG